MWAITEPNIVRRMRGLEPYPGLSMKVREYVRTEWNGDGGAVLGMIDRAVRQGTARRRTGEPNALRRLADGIKALVARAAAGSA